ncbi:outer membrane beta-barrel protein [Rhodobacterales bacterium HKCCSP123]|nr:outer membrane beta-barrel protein [Rhodobacterales bacterium HKCCSP123]
MISRHILAALAGFTVTASAALAGGVVETPEPPVVIAPVAPVLAFEGLYAGLSLGMASAELDYSPLEDDEECDGYECDLMEALVEFLEFDEDGHAYGGFVGYNVQRGNVVFGGEVRGLMFNDVSRTYDFDREFFSTNQLYINGYDGDFPSASLEVDYVVDLRARAGFAAGDALIYGAAGWSRAGLSGEMCAYGSCESMDDTASGPNAGVGVEYNVTESLFVGADYTMRWLEIDGGPDLDLNTLTLRGGFRF